MFNKKIIPDYSKRKVTPQAPVQYTTPVQVPEARERISISKSQELPLFVPPPQPPPIIRQVVQPPPQIPLIKKMTQTPLSDPVPIATSFFSPSLETYPTSGYSYFSANGSSGASNWSLFPALSNVDMAGYSILNGNAIGVSTVNANNIFTNALTASNITTNTITTSSITASVAYISTVNTQSLVLDGNTLTTAGEELLFNGEPLATVSTISTNVASWALYPALSTIFANDNNVTGVKDIQLSTINGQPFITPSSITTWSQFPATSEVNFAQYNLNNVSTINGSPYITGSASAWSAFPATQTVNMAANSLNDVAGINLSNTGTQALLTAGAGNVLNVNGVPVSGGSASAWATFPATSNVTIPDKDLNMTTTAPGVSYNTANLNANVVIGNTGQAPLRPDFTAYCGTVSLGGLANPLTAMNVYSLGSVGINSASGISVAGGGGVSISGAGGVAVTGLGALALNGGNVEIAGAGGVFVNGTGAITVTAGGVFVNGGGVSVAAGGCAITAGGLSVAGGAVTIGTAGLAGGDLTIYGGDLRMSAVGPTKSIITDKIASVGTNTLAITGVSTINGLPYPPSSAVYQATYYKSAAQTLTSGNTDVTFDLTGSWNNTGGYITHTDGTTAFTVVQTGIYQLEFNATVLANGAVYTTTSGKSVGIDITRSPIAEQSVVINSALQATGLNYVMSVGTSYYLVAGDVINLRVGNTFTGGPPTLLQLQNTFDLNTYFTWTYVSSGGAAAYQNPPPVIQAAGTTALIPTTANTLYILTSGTTQNFTTAGLSAGDAGAVWYVKNAQPSGGGGNDVTVQANGTSIAGATSVLHQRTNTDNTASQTLYWNGTTLTMY